MSQAEEESQNLFDSPHSQQFMMATSPNRRRTQAHQEANQQEQVEANPGEEGAPPAKMAKPLVSTASDILKNSTIKIKDCNTKQQFYSEGGTVVAVVAALCAPVREHVNVGKKRIRMALVDKSGIMIFYYAQPKLDIKLGDVLSVKNFKIEHGRATIHHKTVIGRGPCVKVDEKTRDKARTLIAQPIRNYSLINTLLTIHPKEKQLFSVKGYVSMESAMTEVNSPKYKTPNGKILKKEIDVEDLVNNKKICVTLWDQTSLHDVPVGSTVYVQDSPLYTNDMMHYNYLSVWNQDDIIVVPPTSVVETLVILSVEESKTAGNLCIMVKESDSAHPREVSRTTFMEIMPPNLHTKDAQTLRQLCPMEAKAHTMGNEIKRLLIHHYSETDKNEVIDFSSVEDDQHRVDEDALQRILEEEFDQMDDV